MATALRPLLASDDVFAASRAAAGLARQRDITDLPALLDLVYRLSPAGGGTAGSMLEPLRATLDLAVLAGPEIVEGGSIACPNVASGRRRGAHGNGTRIASWTSFSRRRSERPWWAAATRRHVATVTDSGRWCAPAPVLDRVAVVASRSRPSTCPRSRPRSCGPPRPMPPAPAATRSTATVVCHGISCDPTEAACDVAYLADEGGLTPWGCPGLHPGQRSPHLLGCELIGWNVPMPGAGPA